MGDYGYQPAPLNEVLSIGDEGSTRIRLALSTTTRGWDYESTVEITVPSYEMTSEERAVLVNRARDLQVFLRLAGSEERDVRNQQDGLGPFAPAKGTTK